MGKKNQENNNSQNLVELMTISLFIILLAFFILLNAISKVDEKKKKAAINSIVKNFGGAMPIKRGMDSSGGEYFSNGVSPVDLSGLVNNNGESDKRVDVRVSNTKTVLSIRVDRLFYSHGTTVRRSAYPFLDMLAGIIKSNSLPVEISVHSDNIQINPKYNTDNRVESSLRSVNVLKYFITKNHLKAERFAAFGWGEFRPLLPNKSVKAREINRRVDITFMHNKSIRKGKGIFIFKDFFFNVNE